MDSNETFGQQIKWYRSKIGLTQDELADRMDYSTSTIRKIEAGLRRLPPRPKLLEKFADCLNIPPAERPAFFALAKTVKELGEVAYPQNLPSPLTALIGRDQDISTLLGYLRRPKVRLVTLIGPSGVGKTQLALQVAEDSVTTFKDGVYFVTLAGISSPTLIAPTLAQTLGVKEYKGQPFLESIKIFLHSRQILLLLDNFEHVRSAAPLIIQLLVAAPQLKILVTSQARLPLQSGFTYDVRPLPVPNLRAPLSVRRLAKLSAVRLFVERTRAVRSDFTLTAENAAAVAELCVRLDGLPLAIELAAARGRLFSPQALLARLNNRFNLLAIETQDLPPRQKTLRHALDWSYNLLNTEEQLLFARLAVFIGGCSLPAITAICAEMEGPVLDILEIMTSLSDKSLLWRQEQPDGEARLGMLETIREYARERLAERGESEHLLQRHARYYLALIETAPTPARIELLQMEQSNLRAAIEWHIAHREWLRFMKFNAATRFALLAVFHVNEMLRWLETLAAEIEKGQARLPSTWEAFTLEHLGILVLEQNDYARANDFYDKALTLYRQLNDTRGITETLARQGQVAWTQGDFAGAKRASDEALALCRQVSDPISLAYILISLSILVSWNQETEKGLALADEAVRISRQCGDKRELAHTLSQYGWMARYFVGKPAQARACLEESLALYQSMGELLPTANVLGDLALVALDEHNWRQAETYLRQSLLIFKDRNHVAGIVLDLDRMAQVAVKQGFFERAVQLLGAVDVLRKAFQMRRAPDQHAQYEQSLAAAHAQVSAEAWNTAWTRGQTLTLNQAVAFARHQPSGASVGSDHFQ